MPVLHAWQASDAGLSLYPAGSWGPDEANKLLEQDERRWVNPPPERQEP
jgi:glucose-6-phosphate 1-dehydrogenase